MFGGLKKYNRAIATVGAVAAMACAPHLALSATDNAALNLTGTVNASVAVTVSGTGAAASLNLGQNATETSLKVADVTELANTSAGYTVTVSSANLAAGGRCTGAAGTACLFNSTANSMVAISLLKGATSKSFTGSSTQWSDTSAVQLTALASVANIAYAVGATVLPQGNYTETLTFTITSK